MGLSARMDHNTLGATVIWDNYDPRTIVFSKELSLYIGYIRQHLS
jgi:hypothetical protein